MNGFLRRGKSCIFDIEVTDLDVAKYCGSLAVVVLANQDRQKKTNYLEICLEMRHDFTALF